MRRKLYSTCRSMLAGALATLMIGGGAFAVVGGGLAVVAGGAIAVGSLSPAQAHVHFRALNEVTKGEVSGDPQTGEVTIGFNTFEVTVEPVSVQQVDDDGNLTPEYKDYFKMTFRRTSNRPQSRLESQLYGERPLAGIIVDYVPVEFTVKAGRQGQLQAGWKERGQRWFGKSEPILQEGERAQRRQRVTRLDRRYFQALIETERRVRDVGYSLPKRTDPGEVAMGGDGEGGHDNGGGGGADD